MTEPIDRSPLDRLAQRLRAKGALLERIVENSRLLEEDVFLLEGRFNVRFCVDFYDLRSYLAIGSVEEGSAVVGEDEYARMLLFNRLPQPAVLLPVYYLEFRDHIARFFGTKRESVEERQHWIGGLVATIKRAVEALDLAMVALDSGREMELTEADDRARQIVAIVKRTIGKMEAARRAAGLLQRFDALVEQGKIQGIKSAVPERISVEKGRTFRTARAFLDERRLRSKANETDALALATIWRLNQYHQDKKQRFYLVSGSSLMRECVLELNDKVLQEEERIDLRDLEYWKLWFSIAGNEPVPSLRKVRDFRAQVWSDLDALVRRNRRLQSEFAQAARRGQGRDILKLSGEVAQYIESLDTCIGKLFAPMLRIGSSLFLLEDILRPLRDSEGAIASALDHIRALQEEFDRVGWSVAGLRGLLRGLRNELERLLWVLDGEVVIQQANRMRQENQFFGGWTLWKAHWRSQYKELLDRVVARDPSGIRDVFQELSRLTSVDGPAFERYIVAARAHLEEGSVAAAEAELRDVPEGHQDDPEYLLTRALIHERKGDLAAAERLFEDLVYRFDEPIIRLHLGWILRWKWIRERDLNALGQALVQAELAHERTDIKALRLKVETTILLFDVLADFPERERQDERLKQGLEEVDELLTLAERHGRLEDWIGPLKALRRRLRRQGRGGPVGSEAPAG